MLLEEFQLKSGVFTLLLSTSGANAQNHRAILRGLDPLHARVQVIALCGPDEEGRAALEDWVKRETSLAVCCLGLTDRMSTLLPAVSAVVARADATTAGEALLCGCPVIFSAFGGMTPHELPTWRYFPRATHRVRRVRARRGPRPGGPLARAARRDRRRPRADDAPARHDDAAGRAGEFAQAVTCSPN